MKQLLTLRQVAEILNISYSTLSKNWKQILLSRGAIPINVAGGPNCKKAIYRFRPEEVERVIEKMRVIQK